MKFPYIKPTVDGRNPAPVDLVNNPLFTGFHTSQVVQDFFHQQYGFIIFKFTIKISHNLQEVNIP